MSIPTQKIDNDLNQLAEHVRALIEATADVTGDHVKEARDRLLAALNSGVSLSSRIRAQAAYQTRACDLVIHQNPYQSIGIAMGLGALLGYLAGRECAAGHR
jgi:ElaB/YqjD/DUF883 family membrane-anchored ribosome-binding protein